MLSALLAVLIAVPASAAGSDPHAALGVQYFNQKDYYHAVNELRQALAAAPGDAFLNVKLCHALERVDDRPAGVAQCRKAVALWPESDEGHGALGNLLVRVDQSLAAIDEYRLCLKYNDKAAGIRSNLGFLYGKMKRYEDEERECRRALADEPDNDLAHECLGTSLLDRGRAAEAVPSLRRAVALNPKNKRFNVYLADALSETGRDEEALNLYRLETGQQSEFAYYRLGKFMDKRGRNREAAEALTKFLDLTKESQSRYYPSERADAAKVLARLGPRP